MKEIIVGLIEAIGNLICNLEPDAADDFAEIIAVVEAIFDGIQG